MVKSFRFLWQFIWVNLAAVLGFAAIVIVLSLIHILCGKTPWWSSCAGI